MDSQVNSGVGSTQASSTEIGSGNTAAVQQSSIGYTVDVYADGLALGQHQLATCEDPRDYYYLRLPEDPALVQLRSHYALHCRKPVQDLERGLQRLQSQGALASTTIYLGVASDPFSSNTGHFEVSMRFIELFKRYKPGLLVVQTRSPLVVLAMPVLRALEKSARVTLAIETPLEEVAQRYTPGLPRVQERWKVADALRKLGVQVGIQVNPLLPYGEWRSDAAAFAAQISAHADSIHVRGLHDGSPRMERRLRRLPLAQRLAQDRKYHWLRADAANPLITAIEQLCPEKLKLPQAPRIKDRQGKLFAA
jgi:hypothetical protein